MTDKLEKITERIDRALYYSMKKITSSEIAQNIRDGEDLSKLEAKILIHYCLCRIIGPKNIVRLRYFLNRIININNSAVDFETKLAKIEVLMDEINMR